MNSVFWINDLSHFWSKRGYNSLITVFEMTVTIYTFLISHASSIILFIAISGENSDVFQLQAL